MTQIEWMVISQVALAVLILMTMYLLVQLKTQVDAITKEVTNYISFITEDEKELNHQESTIEKIRKTEREKAQDELIQAVLGEYF